MHTRLPVRHLLWILSLAASLVVAAPCAAADTLRLAVSRTPLSLPVYVAHEKGYFASESLDVQLLECIGGQRCLRHLFDNQAELATVAELPVVMAGFERSDFAVIATFVSASDDLKIVVRGAGVPSLQDKRIGVTIGSTAQYFLDLHLLAVGVDPRGLQIIDIKPENLVAALSEGKVDAVAAWEPYGFHALKALGDKGRAVPSSNAYIQTFNLVVQRRLVGLRDASLEKLLRAMRRAEQFIQHEPDAAKAILRNRLQLEQEVVEHVWPAFSYRLALDQSLLTTMESQARWALREGHIKGRNPPNFLFLVHTAPLRSVKPTAVGIGR